MDVNGFLAEPIMFHYQFCYLQLILHCFGVKHFHSWQLFWKKGFIGLSKKRSRSWGVKSKPPMAGLGKEGNMSAILGWHYALGKKDVSFERIYIGYRQGGQKKVKMWQF